MSARDSLEDIDEASGAPEEYSSNVETSVHLRLEYRFTGSYSPTNPQELRFNKATTG